MQEYERLLLSPSADRDWLLIEEGVDLAREREIESILAIANGYLGIRVSIAEGGRSSRPSIFAAAIYVVDEDLGPRFAVLPHWLCVRTIPRNAGMIFFHKRPSNIRRDVLQDYEVICSISWYVVRSFDTMSIASATGVMSESADSCRWALPRISVTSTARKIPRIKR
jgi:hypothetical protein